MSIADDNSRADVPLRQATPGGPATRRSPLTHDRFEALGQPGCAVCRLSTSATDRYLSTWIYEVSSDMGNRMRLDQAHRFCTLHTWAIADSHAAFQLALAYETVVNAGLDNPKAHLTLDVPTGAWWQRLLGAREAPERNATETLEEAVAGRWRTRPACQMRAEEEQRLLGTIAELAADDVFRQAFAASGGFCLWHFRAVHTAAINQSTDAAHWLEGAERACLERVAGLVKEMLRKHDYRFHDEPQGAEMQSWRLVAELVAGRCGLR